MGLRAVFARFHFKFLNKAFKFLHVFAIWVILPIVVFVSTARYTATQILGFGNALLFGFIAVGACFVSAVAISHLSKDDRKTTISMVLNSAFMNVTYLGFPAIYALLGKDALGPAALFAMGVGTLHLIFGTVLASSAAKKHLTPRAVATTVLTFPAVFALIAALLFVAFTAPIPNSAPIPPAVSGFFDAYLAMPFFALMLLLVGYQIPLVNPRRYLEDLVSVGALRFVVSPIVTFITILAFGLTLNFSSGVPGFPSSTGPSFILSMMPPAVFNIILAHNFKLDEKRYGALVFYPTLISLFVILPIAATFMP